ncbi:MAG: Tripartite tricarboxylate transporter TctA family protein [Chloroflexi bacterium]|nr:Tripartite tricarboxylate transporter TctA family protein [Chloroflexota bacterium]
MIESFVQGLLNLFAVRPVTLPFGEYALPATFGIMMLGMAIGFVVGILPGLGGAVTLALMLPFTFAMAPLDAFAFLLGMLSVTATTGDITSVLFGVPGEATTAATVVDGHPMAKRGEAGRALGAVLTSSMVGALVGAFALALLIPVVRPLILTFQSPELFMLTVLGITFVASLSGGAVLKGLVAGGFGFLLSMIGLDPQTGVQRATFGQLELWDGIGLVPITIGLFAIPETVELAVRGTSIAGRTVAKVGGVMEGVRDTFRHWQLTVRCSLLGTAIGIMPGLGGAVGQWIAYAHAVQSSPHPETFGTGRIEGVLGPGAANNSKEGGNLILTVLFGVPGSVSMAILLGAFLIKGIVPGPDMLDKNLTLTFSMVWIIVVTNVLTVGICLLFINQLVRVTYVRGSLIIPFILFLVFFGAYAEKNALFDVGLALLFGLLGLVMVQTDWPRPPLVLGLVLGKLTERYLFLSVNRYEWEWLLRPWVIVFAFLIVAVIVYSVREQRRGREKASRLISYEEEI